MPRVPQVPIVTTLREAQIIARALAWLLAVQQEDRDTANRVDFPLLALLPDLPGAERPRYEADRHETRRNAQRARSALRKVLAAKEHTERLVAAEEARRAAQAAADAAVASVAATAGDPEHLSAPNPETEP